MLYNIDNRDSKRIVVMRAICLLMVIYQHQFGGGTGLEYATGTLADSELLNAIMYIISRIVSHFAVPLFFNIALPKRVYMAKQYEEETQDPYYSLHYLGYNIYCVIFYRTDYSSHCNLFCKS